jgi:flagellar biosynthesis regulator FlaF
MIDGETFEFIRRKHCLVASWAVWGDFGDRPNENMGNLDVLDPEKNPALLDELKPNVIMIGLNVSREIEGSFKNFHAPGPVFKVRYAFRDTPYYGAYMTDLIKNHIEVDSGIVGETLKSKPEQIEESFREFRQEMADLKTDRPIIFAFGDRVHNLLSRHLDRSEYAHLIRLRHYSDRRKNKENYKTEVIERIREAGLPTGNCKGQIDMTEKLWDVFVSYKRNPDEEVALDLLAALERAGLRCWVAPRDVRVTSQKMMESGVVSDSGWDSAIPFAIKHSRAMVVVISDAAMKDGKQMQKEIYIGDKNDIKFFPVLIEDVPLRDSFDLHLGREQWINCFSGNGSQRFLSVASEVSGFLGVTGRAQELQQPKPMDSIINAADKSMVSPPAEVEHVAPVITHPPATQSDISSTGRLLQDFWTQLVQHLTSHAPRIRPQKPSAKNYLNTQLSRKGFSLRATATVRPQRLGVDLYIELPEAKQHFTQLLAQKAEIESKLGFDLDWQEMPGAMSVRIATYFSDASLDDKGRWSEYLNWLADRMTKMESVFAPLVQLLP